MLMNEHSLAFWQIRMLNKVAVLVTVAQKLEPEDPKVNQWHLV